MIAPSRWPHACQPGRAWRQSAAPFFGLATLIALLAQPSAALADAVYTGDPTVSPGPDVLGQLVSLVTAVAAVGVGIAILVGLGYALSRIGGPPVSADDPRPTERSAMQEQLGTILAGAILVGAAIGGFLGGRAMAYVSSQGGLSEIFGTVYLVVFGGGLVVGMVIVGLVATKFRHGQMSWPIKTMFLAAALVVVGALGGEVSARSTGGTYHTPVVLRAPARLHVVLADASAAFVARDDGEAECRSVGDSRSFSDLSGLDLGELGPGTLRVGFTLGTDGPNAAMVEYFIDAGDLPEGAQMISWAGIAQTSDMTADSTSGRLTFTDLPLARSDGKPAPDSTPPPVEAWPSTLSGSMTWACDPWSPQLGDGVPPPPSMTPKPDAATAVPTDDAGPVESGGVPVEATPFAPPPPICPPPASAVVAPVVVVSTGEGAGLVAAQGSSTVSTCTTTATEDRVLTDPVDALVAHPGDVMTLTLSAGWGFLRWEGYDHSVVGDAADVWPPVEVAGRPATIEIPVPNRLGDSVAGFTLWLVGLDGRAVGQFEIRVLVRVG
jgi:MFS family permease